MKLNFYQQKRLTKLKLTDKMRPLEFTRITTIYVDTEDRLGLVGEDENGKHQRLWLTQRLLSRLLEKLLDWLPQTDVRIQEIAQQSAQAKHGPEHPVIPSSECLDWLVNEITLESSEGVIGLLFKSDRCEYVAIVRFNEISLRQWLDILFRQYQHAGWLSTDWPNWFVSEVEVVLPAGVEVH